MSGSIKPNYQIHILEDMPDQWLDGYEQLSIKRADKGTTVSVYLADQAALHGLLARIRDLGLNLTEVKQLK